MDLLKEAKQAWREYCNAIIKAFNFPKESLSSVPPILQNKNVKENDLKRFIQYCKLAMNDVINSKWIGED